ncbi:hypothetical protein CJU89_5542 [Yarrowia sp. B02]|nr:hypothetical protein CJU89_5542 [Yarrowia sp. B02]
MDVVKRKRILDDDNDVSDNEEYDHLRPQKIRATSMAKIMNLSQDELQHLHFYIENTNPILLLATGSKDSLWMGAAPAMSMSSPALAKACQLFAEAHMYINQNPCRYLLEGEKPLPKAKGKPNMSKVIGYVPLNDDQVEKLIVGFTDALKTLRREIETLDETSNFDGVLIAAVIVSLCAMLAQRSIPLVNFNGTGDLFSVFRMINDIQAIYDLNLGRVSIENWVYQVPVPNRHRLPHEEDLLKIVDLVEGVGEEPRRVRGILNAAILTLEELYNLDMEGKCVTHLAAWSVWWQTGFLELKNAHNPYALLIICFWCAYVHNYHALFWWGDRIQEDLYCIVDQLPPHLIRYVEWPLSVVTNFEHDHLDWIRTCRS